VTTRLVQLRTTNGARAVAATRNGTTHFIRGATSLYSLAREAIEAKISLDALVTRRGVAAELIDLAQLLAGNQVLAPIDHPDSAHVWLTGTGLTHLGSADARDRMHAKAHSADASDSLKMFRLGLEGGKVHGAGPGFSRSGSTRATAPRSSRPRRRWSPHLLPRMAARSPNSPAFT
jgi:hypothetical protein